MKKKPLDNVVQRKKKEKGVAKAYLSPVFEPVINDKGVVEIMRRTDPTTLQPHR